MGRAVRTGARRQTANSHVASGGFAVAQHGMVKQSQAALDPGFKPSVSVCLPLVATYQTADPWAALADGTRRTIFKRLAGGPMAVGELAEGLPVSRPAVSQHLKVLKCAGLVRDRAAGTRRVYQVDPDGLAALRAELDVFWDRALGAFQAIADQEGEG